MASLGYDFVSLDKYDQIYSIMSTSSNILVFYVLKVHFLISYYLGTIAPRFQIRDLILISSQRDVNDLKISLTYITSNIQLGREWNSNYIKIKE